MGGIFLSYRRDDNRHAAGRLYDCLQQRFSSEQIFFDVDAIEPGLSFLHVIEERIRASDAIIVVIGLNWLDARDGEGHRRLDDPEDFVRGGDRGGPTARNPSDTGPDRWRCNPPRGRLAHSA